jgi:hypothetical protein
MTDPRPRPNGERPKPAFDRELSSGRELSEQLQRLGVADDPVISVPPEVLARYNARVLDPSTAHRVVDQPPPSPTVYLADRLLVRGDTHADVEGVMNGFGEALGVEVEESQAHRAQRDTYLETAREAGVEEPERLFPRILTVSPLPKQSAPIDAWQMLQGYRARVGNEAAAGEVSLDHLLTTTKHIVPWPLDPPDAGNRSLSSYGQPGWGGRQPVAWLGAEPNRQDQLSCRRPVVAVLDTGVGDHPWLPVGQYSCIKRNVSFGKTSLGLPDPAGAETTGVVSHPLEGVLDAYSGHGTFIAGLIRQMCPDADILSIRVTPSEGAVPEHVLIQALGLLALRQAGAQANGSAADVVDVVSLSLGYYPEHADATTAHPFLFDPIDALARLGVIVVASAGNDATSRPMFPAAFTPYPGGLVSAPDASCAPVISVGATNPDGTTALFSNAGAWVVCSQPGAGVVSTFPAFDASGGAAYSFGAPAGQRATIDPDNFTSGFGIWSGTSFAAPVLAGKFAQSIVDGTCGDADPVDAQSMLDRAWTAIGTHTGLSKP